MSQKKLSKKYNKRQLPANHNNYLEKQKKSSKSNQDL